MKTKKIRAKKNKLPKGHRFLRTGEKLKPGDKYKTEHSKAWDASSLFGLKVSRFESDYGFYIRPLKTKKGK